MRYIYLKSSDSLDVYPDNVLSDFCVKLPQAIELEGSWELALVEIQYPTSWEKYPYSLWLKYIVNCHFAKERKIIPFTERVELKISKAKNVDRITKLMEQFNAKSKLLLMKREADTRRIYITTKSDETICDHIRNHCKTNTNEEYYTDEESSDMDEDDSNDGANCVEARATIDSLLLSHDLADILGYGSSRSHRHAFEIIARAPPFVPLYPSSLYVHCDIVEHQLTGSSYEQILRVVPVSHTNDRNSVQSAIYDRPYFKSLYKKHFDAIRIKIHDENNSRIRFEGGVIVIVLALRKQTLLSR